MTSHRRRIESSSTEVPQPARAEATRKYTNDGKNVNMEKNEANEEEEDEEERKDDEEDDDRLKKKRDEAPPEPLSGPLGGFFEVFGGFPGFVGFVKPSPSG